MLVRFPEIPHHDASISQRLNSEDRTTVNAVAPYVFVYNVPGGNQVTSVRHPKSGTNYSTVPLSVSTLKIGAIAGRRSITFLVPG
jgi:hypothetical protein